MRPFSKPGYYVPITTFVATAPANGAPDLWVALGKLGAFIEERAIKTGMYDRMHQAFNDGGDIKVICTMFIAEDELRPGENDTIH